MDFASGRIACTRKFIGHVVVAVLFPALALAQAPSGALRGTLRDASGGALPGVTVSAVAQSGAETTAVSGLDGAYEIAGLAAGVYVVKAVLPGFQTYERADIQVGAAPVVVNIAMTVGGLKESVLVAASIDRFQVVPARPTNSLFGLDKPLAEIPRSISVIEADHIARYDVRTVNDLVTVAPGSFTGSYFGVPGQPLRAR